MSAIAHSALSHLRRPRLGLSLLALAGWLAAAALCFGLFFFLGRLTAETRTTMRSTTPIGTPAPARELTGLFRVEAIPRLGGKPGRAAAATPVPIDGVSRPGPAADAAPGYLLVPQFEVRYRVRALASSVRFERLALSGLPAGVALEVRCLRACTVAERAVAPANGEFVSKRLAGWLRRGAVFELEARKAGWVGAYVSVTVTGLPDGVRFERSCLPPTGPARPTSCSRYLRQ